MGSEPVVMKGNSLKTSMFEHVPQNSNSLSCNCPTHLPFNSPTYLCHNSLTPMSPLFLASHSICVPTISTLRNIDVPASVSASPTRYITSYWFAWIKILYSCDCALHITLYIYTTALWGEHEWALQFNGWLMPHQCITRLQNFSLSAVCYKLLTCDSLE